ARIMSSRRDRSFVSSPSLPDPRLQRVLWQWLALGALALALLPAARGQSAWLGWLPFWAVIAPSSALLMLHRHVLAAAWRATLVLRTPRRRQHPSRQARR